MKSYEVWWTNKRSGRIIITTFNARDWKEAKKFWRKMNHNTSCRLIKIVEKH